MCKKEINTIVETRGKIQSYINDGGGEKNCYGRNCFPASKKIFKNLQHLGPENVFSGLLMTSQRRIQQQISRCADSISKHQSRRSLLNAQQHELGVGRWEECRWQPFPLSETALPKAYPQVQGSEKTCFGNCKPIHT